MHKVFVYGSLLKGLGNHRLLADSTFLGEDNTKPEFLMVDLGWFPGIIEDIDGVSIKGEVYEVSNDTLSWLDSLEGYRPSSPSFGLYNRKQIDTKFGKALVYIYNHSGKVFTSDKLVKDGDWRSHYQNKKR